MRWFLVLAGGAFLPACAPVGGDGAFRVEGEIVGVSDACDLAVFRGSEREPIDRQKVSGAFLETFVVAPTPQTYRVDLRCRGEVVRSLRVDYQGPATYRVPASLGRVIL